VAAHGGQGVSGYRTQSADTSREVEEMVLARWRSMTPAEKLVEIDDLHRSVEDVVMMGIRMRHPEADDREVLIRFAALKYDRSLIIEAFGWDPAVHGF
jgi:hypothetical protein